METYAVPEHPPADAIEIRVDPFPHQRDLDDLWRATWEIDAIADFRAVLTRSLVHIGAYEGDKLLGFANMAWDGGQHAFLVDVCVHPEHRNKGIGQRLVDKAVATARKRGVVWIHVDFEPHLKAFYLECGFKSIEAGIMKVTD